MTSKEALKDISYLLLNECDDLKNKDIWKKDIEIIKKDLEVLEILTKYDVLSVIGNDEDYEKVKWYIATHKKLDLYGVIIKWIK